MSPLTEHLRLRPTTSPAISPEAVQRLVNLKAVILLDGSVRSSDLANAAGRSILNLPVDTGLTVLDVWQKQISDLADSIGLEKLPCRILLGHSSRSPALSALDVQTGFSVERDSWEFRGTGGALRDLLADRYEDSAEFLVAGAAQVLLEPLSTLGAQAAAKGGEVTLVAYDDGSPSNLGLIQCSAIRRLPTAGFIDLKEKGLTMIASDHQVTVLQRPCATSAPVRSLREYITAVAAYHRVSRGNTLAHSPFEERWSSSFSIVESGTSVDPSARLHDSVVLAGGRVEPNGLLVRSLVCADGSVSAGRRVTESLVNRAL